MLEKYLLAIYQLLPKTGHCLPDRGTPAQGPPGRALCPQSHLLKTPLFPLHAEGPPHSQAEEELLVDAGNDRRHGQSEDGGSEEDMDRLEETAQLQGRPGQQEDRKAQEPLRTDAGEAPDPPVTKGAVTPPPAPPAVQGPSPFTPISNLPPGTAPAPLGPHCALLLLHKQEPSMTS